MINVFRSTSAPESLTTKKSWNEPDVRERLWSDFLGKCYLCEQRVDFGAFVVDHRKYQNEFGDLALEWTNLFPACDPCNGARKRKNYPAEGLLDPAGGDDVENRVVQWLELSAEAKPSFAQRDSEDHAAHNTAQELDRIHNRDTPKSADLRTAITSQLSYVQGKIIQLLQMQQSGEATTERYFRLQAELRALVSRRAPFTMLVRSRVNEVVQDLFD